MFDRIAKDEAQLATCLSIPPSAYALALDRETSMYFIEGLDAPEVAQIPATR